jgi:hypothetical protein
MTTTTTKATYGSVRGNNCVSFSRGSNATSGQHPPLPPPPPAISCKVGLVRSVTDELRIPTAFWGTKGSTSCRAMSRDPRHKLVLPSVAFELIYRLNGICNFFSGC